MSRTLKIGLVAALIGLGAAAPRGAAAQPADAGAPATKADAGAADAGALPAGHPPVEQMPAGHPPVAQTPPGHPPTGANRARPSSDPGFFMPPPDGADEDPTLPPGTLVVTIRDAQDRPVPGAPIRLDVLHSSVARGDSRERKTAVADQDGAARFDGLTVGSGTTYKVSTTRGPATFSASPFPLGDQAGKRAVVHAYDSTTNLDEAFVVSQGGVFLALREGAIVVEQQFTLMNLSPNAWMADLTIPLPKGYKALNREDPETDARLDEVNDVGLALRGTVAPGRHTLSYRYNIPLDKKAQQTIRIELPPRMAQARVIAEAAKNMGLQVEGFQPAQRSQLQNGMKVLFTEQRAQPMSGGIKPLAITLTGLPTPPPARYAAAILAALVAALGIGLMFRKQDEERTLDDEARRELMEARDALLDEFVELERLWKKKEIGPKSYSRVRTALLDALARIVSMIEEAGPVAAPAKAGQDRWRRERGKPPGSPRRPSSSSPRS